MATVLSSVHMDDKVTSYISKNRKMLINGQWVEAASGKTFPTYNPATGEVLARVAEGDREDIDRAVKAARAAFETGPWSKMTPSERGRLIWKLGDLLEQNLEEFAELEMLDNGKPLKGRAGGGRPAGRGSCSATWRAGRPRLKAIPFRFPPDQVSGLHLAPAGRSGRSDHPVEFSLADGGLEAGPGVGYRMLRGDQAGGTDAAFLPAAGRAGSGGRNSRRSREHRPGLWRNRGRSPGRASGRRQSRLHRFHGSRQTDSSGRRRQSEESVARVGRQISQRGFRRRRL